MLKKKGGDGMVIHGGPGARPDKRNLKIWQRFWCVRLPVSYQRFLRKQNGGHCACLVTKPGKLEDLVFFSLLGTPQTPHMLETDLMFQLENGCTPIPFRMGSRVRLLPIARCSWHGEPMYLCLDFRRKLRVPVVLIPEDHNCFGKWRVASSFRSLLRKTD